MSYRIFVIEDDPTIASSLADYLTRYDYAVTRVTDFRQVEQQFLQTQPHLVLMDVTLPYQDGFHLTRALRRHGHTPILFLTARAGQMDQVLGLELGADDYITKPFDLEVLHARIKAVLRRTYGEYAVGESGTTLRAGALTLDLAAAELSYTGQAPQPLTRNELKLLALLIERADRVVSREDCLEALWDDTHFVDDNTLTVNINRVRAKLDTWGLKEALETRRGLGYILVTARLEGAR
jgi:DNA-binding response OmpR family regulator